MSTTKTKILCPNASIGNDIESLEGIHLKNKNIAIYQRNIKELQQRLKPLIAKSFEIQAHGTTAEITASLQAYFNDNLPQYGLLLEDIYMLLNLFKQITKATSFKVLLATIDSNMCRKFHTDMNDLRLLCTYVGPGTLWLPDEAVNRKALQTRCTNQDIVLDNNLIQQVNTGDIAILKGALYPEANAVLHRSPTIETTGEKRLLLRIDTNESLNFWS